jgi:hypothetical protein
VDHLRHFNELRLPSGHHQSKQKGLFWQGFQDRLRRCPEAFVPDLINPIASCGVRRRIVLLCLPFWGVAKV